MTKIKQNLKNTATRAMSLPDRRETALAPVLSLLVHPWVKVRAKADGWFYVQGARAGYMVK